MAHKEISDTLFELLESEASERGLELVACEQAGGRGRPIFRVYFDTEDGITDDLLTETSKWVSDLLDREDPIPGAYTLEVSSPGIDRILYKLSDFERFAGEEANIKLRRQEGRRGSYTGELQGVDGDVVNILVDGVTVGIPYADIAKARLKGRIDFHFKGGKDR